MQISSKSVTLKYEAMSPLYILYTLWNGLKLSPKKCQLFKKELQYKGNTIFIQDRRVCVKPQELEGLINKCKLIQKLLPKQADIDKILKIIQRNVLKGMHLPVTIKEIQEDI